MAWMKIATNFVNMPITDTGGNYEGQWKNKIKNPQFLYFI